MCVVLSAWRDLGLGVPDGDLLAALYRAEHDATTGTANATDADGEPWLLHGFGMGSTEQCSVWPTDAELEAHRRLTIEVRQ